jgi:phytoene synthase
MSSDDPAPILDVDQQECRVLMRGGSKTFSAASLLLPTDVRIAATGLYAFCRLADDAVDLADDPRGALGALRQRLDLIYAGTPAPIPADREFAQVVARYRIPRPLPEALLEGFEWDAEGRRYETYEDLTAYGTRVAGTVGAMMALLMGTDDAVALARATDMGVAMQLTNIARDVGEDARAGRLYLPLAWLRESGIDADALVANPGFSPALAGVVERLLAAADVLYARAAVGIDALPARYRAAMHAARLLYAEIGRAVERQGLDSVSSRAVVGWSDKARVIARAIRASSRRHVPDDSPALPAAQFLVTAAAGCGAAAVLPERRAYPWRRLEERLVWTLELFERLERKEREAALLRPVRETVLERTAEKIVEASAPVEAMHEAPPWHRVEERIAWTLELFERLERHEQHLAASATAAR